MPPELTAALSAYREAKIAFETLPPSHKREFIKHITEGNKPQTRSRRAEKAVMSMVQKYVKQ